MNSFMVFVVYIINNMTTSVSPSSRLGFHILYNTATHSVICEGLYFLAYRKRLHYHIIPLRRDILVYKTSSIPPHFNKVPVPSQEHDMCQICICFYNIPIIFWNGSDDVVWFVLRFITSNDFKSYLLLWVLCVCHWIDCCKFA